MHDSVFLLYLLANLLVPLFVLWRRGLTVALTVTGVELVLVAPVIYLMLGGGVFADLIRGNPPPTHPFAMRAQGTIAGAIVMMMGISAAGAALLGGTLAATCAAAIALWRALAKRASQ